MQRSRTARGAGCARSMLARPILLFCIGWILNSSGNVVGAPVAVVIERNSNDYASNNKIDNQPITLPDSIKNNHQDHPSDDSDKATTLTALTENVDNNRDKIIKTEHNNGGGGDTLSLEILYPDNIALFGGEETNVSRNASNEQQIIALEYQPNLVIRCAARGNPKPNVTWEYVGDSFSDYVLTNSMAHGSGDLHSSGNNGDRIGDMESNEAWVDLKLPKLNNAFYGKLRCKAENKFGNATWEIELIHNANSSTFMKVVRCALAGAFLLFAVLLVKGLMWADKMRHDKLYERLPPQDLEIINKFKKGLAAPPPSPCSSIMVAESSKSLLDGATSCVKGIEINVTGDRGENTGNAIKDGYRPVKHGSSSPDLQKRFINGGTSTPSTCSSAHVLDIVNSWTNYVPYDDKMETSSQHFIIDFSKIIENGSFGTVYAGKVRNDLTMEWSTVAVKSGKVEGNDDSYMLELILTELKILASLPKLHDNIMNLKGAYTKMLHKRQALVLVDYCELGTLANFIDLNRENFRDIFTINLMDDANNGSHRESSTQKNTQSNQSGINFTAKSSDVSIIHSQKLPEGKTVQQQHAISHRELLAWAWQIAEGMNFLHKNRVVHGNLSTANIYLTAEFKIKIGNIGHPPLEETMQYNVEETSKNWLTVPQYGYEQFSKRTDIWDYGRVIWEIFSLRDQQCPDNKGIANFMGNGEIHNDVFEEEYEFDIPQYATVEIFELMLCCWNENVTLCPEFDFFAKSFKKLYKDVIANNACAKDKSQN